MPRRQSSWDRTRQPTPSSFLQHQVEMKRASRATFTDANYRDTGIDPCFPPHGLNTNLHHTEPPPLVHIYPSWCLSPTDHREPNGPIKLQNNSPVPICVPQPACVAPSSETQWQIFITAMCIAFEWNSRANFHQYTSSATQYKLTPVSVHCKPWGSWYHSNTRTLGKQLYIDQCTQC